MEQHDDRIAHLERLVAEQQQALEAQRRMIDQLVAERPAVVPPPRARSRDDAVRDGVSRRDVLRRALVAGGAVVAGSAALAVADAAPAAAATGDAIKAGQQTNTEATTVLYGDAAPASYPFGIATVTDTTFDKLGAVPLVPGAITGISTSGNATGVSGYGTTTGVYALSDTNVGLIAKGAVGVEATSFSSYALVAQTSTNNDHTAALIQSHGTGTALELRSDTGAALLVQGTAGFLSTAFFLARTHFANSGTVRVRGTRRRPSRSATVTDAALSRTSKVIATIQGDGGTVGIAGVTVNVAKKTFTVTLTAKVARYVTIAWFVID